MVVHYNRLKDASQQKVAAQEAATDETSTPTPATGTVTNTGAEAESNTDLGNTNTENPTDSTVSVNIPNGMIVSRKSEVIPIETRPRLVVSSPVVGQNVHNENCVVDDMVGVQEYMQNLTDSALAAADRFHSSVVDLYIDEQQTNMGDTTDVSSQSKDSEADTWVGQETRAGRKTKTRPIR